MKVRELLVAVKFAPDTASIAQTEQTITSMKNKMAGMGTAAVGVGSQIDASIGDSLNRVVELLEISNEQFYALAQGLAEGFSEAFSKVNTQVETVKSSVEDVKKAKKEAYKEPFVNERELMLAQERMEKYRSAAYRAGDAFGWMTFNIRNAVFQGMMFAGIGFSVQRFIAMADQWKVVTGQIKNVVKSEQEALDVREKLYAMASRTRQGYQQAAGLFTSVSRSAKELGKSTTQILDFTENVAKAMLIGGGSAESQQAALIQLGQALGSGTLRGDELNSILEQAPVLAKTIADGMGITIGQLRQYGREGKLTAQALFEAVQKQAKDLDRQLGNTPWTFRQALGLIQNSMLKLFGTIEEKTGVVSTMASWFAKIAKFIDMCTENANLLINGLKLAAFWMGALFVVTKGGAVLNFFITLYDLIRVIAGGLQAAGIAGLAFRSSLAADFAQWLKVSFLPLLPWLLLLTAIFVLLEDIYGWANGQDSLIGSIFGDYDDVMKKISIRWEALKAEFIVAGRQVASAFTSAIEAIGDVIAWVADLLWTVFLNATPLGALIKLIRDNWDEICKFIDSACEKIKAITGFDIKATVQGIVERYTGGDNVARTAGAATKINNGQYNSNVNVYMGSYATPEDVGKAVAKANSEYFDEAMEQVD